MPDFDSTTKHSTKSNKKPWECLAITLDPEGRRYQTFTENNSHLEVDAFQGIKGAELSKEEIIKKGLATEDLLTSGLSNNGSLGAASSHRAIWHIAAKEGRGHFVLEDDAHTHPRINDFINDNLDRLMNIDICIFGINTDSILQSISPAGLRSVSIFEPKFPNQEWIRNALSKTTPQKVELHRLLKAFGLCAYFISPNGARRLEEKIFPLSTRVTQIPLITDKMPACGTDRAANGAYSQLQAFVSQPFLAYTPNIDSSTRG